MEKLQTFSEYELRALFAERTKAIFDYIKSLSDEDIMSGQDETIANNMFEQHRFIPVEIEGEVVENRKLEKTKVKAYSWRDSQKYIMVEGIQVTSTFPYTGDEILFRCRASTFSLGPNPIINLFSNYFTISASETLETMDKVENKNKLFDSIKRDLNDVKKFVEYCNKDIVSFNNSIKTYTLSELRTRKEKVEKFYNISKMLEIPITKTNPKIIEEIKIERKIIPLIKNKNTATQEYSISDNIYAGILDMIKHQGSTFERTPKTCSKLNEEELRDFILGALNAVYKGQANGEAFRNNGKTDICIEYENRAAFVAECKFWGGKKTLTDALSQLQSYTTWRDNKLCLIVFSENKDFFKVLDEIEKNIASEENYVSQKKLDKNEFELKVRSKNNNGQIIKIRIFTFNLSI